MSVNNPDTLNVSTNPREMLQKGLDDAGFMILGLVNQNQLPPDVGDNETLRPLLEDDTGPVTKQDTFMELPDGIDVYMAHCQVRNSEKAFFYLKVEWPDERIDQSSFIHYFWDVDDPTAQGRLVNLPSPYGRHVANELLPEDISEIQKIMDVCVSPDLSSALKLSKDLKTRVSVDTASTDPVLMAFYGHKINGYHSDEDDESNVAKEIIDMYELDTDGFRKAVTKCLAGLIKLKTAKELTYV